MRFTLVLLAKYNYAILTFIKSLINFLRFSISVIICELIINDEINKSQFRRDVKVLALKIFFLA